jgi:hypothetical protein
MWKDFFCRISERHSWIHCKGPCRVPGAGSQTLRLERESRRNLCGMQDGLVGRRHCREGGPRARGRGRRRLRYIFDKWHCLFQMLLELEVPHPAVLQPGPLVIMTRMMISCALTARSGAPRCYGWHCSSGASAAPDGRSSPPPSDPMHAATAWRPAMPRMAWSKFVHRILIPCVRN